jgi:tetratricopeptide (TPR) repeat protein
LATVREAPAGTDAFTWQLRRARILVLGGDTSGGGEAMLLLLQSHETLDERQQDLVRQVVFDLQTANAHQAALALFEKLLEFTDDITAQRELYYWMAESRLGLQDYSEAARLYLKSAMLIGEDAMDPWAQTARYHAASALAKAGMLHDARALFSHLLRVTKETNRRAVLQHELQKLWLLEDQHSEVSDYGG